MDQQEIDGAIKHMLSEKGIKAKNIDVLKYMEHPYFDVENDYQYFPRLTLWEKIKLFFTN